ncbi:MAG: hypothetical protein M3319_11795, partial [Actinomycetota bacterium]|nr:hypothetical protein [Actinomycetota bacterium]
MATSGQPVAGVVRTPSPKAKATGNTNGPASVSGSDLGRRTEQPVPSSWWVQPESDPTPTY